MFLHYRTRGFILKKEDRGEADQLFAIYAKDFGRLEILAKAIRKITSKLRAGAELFYLSEIEFIQGKTYKTLTDAILIERFENLRKSLPRLKIASRISEVFDNLVKGQEADERIWQLLNETFKKLNNWKIENSLKTENCKLEIVYYYFFWNLISNLGYKPELYYCSSCQRKLKPEKLYFSKKEGGIICQSCFKKIKLATLGILIKPEIVKILRKILERDWKILSRLKVEKFYLESLEKISKSYLSKILEKNEEDF